MIKHDYLGLFDIIIWDIFNDLEYFIRIIWDDLDH